MPDRIMLVEDDSSLAAAVGYALEQEGFKVEALADGACALSAFQAAPPGLVILDLMLPGLSGWQLLSAFRRSGDTPVIILTARVEEADRVAGLEMGADDYVTKPFSMRELVARVRVALRRRREPDPAPAEPSAVAVGEVMVDLSSHEVTVAGRPVSCSPKEYDLLVYLMRSPGRVRSRGEILRAVWGQEDFLDERTVYVHIRWLREKIESDPAHPQRLLTVHGVGYKFAPHHA
jgi:DNA-binding response OmpR family regulator